MTGQQRTPRLGLVHTVPGLAPVFDAMIRPASTAELVHVVDNWLLAEAIASGITEQHLPRLSAHLNHLAVLGCQAVLVTCSSIGEVTDLAATRHDLQVVRVDRAMAQQAVALATAGPGRITALATLPSTLAPTGRIVAEAAPDDVQVCTELVVGAADAAGRGDQAQFAALVSTAVDRARQRGEVVVLAQASMADALGDRTDPLVLSSPSSACRALLDAAANP